MNGSTVRVVHDYPDYFPRLAALARLVQTERITCPACRRIALAQLGRPQERAA